MIKNCYKHETSSPVHNSSLTGQLPITLNLDTSTLNTRICDTSFAPAHPEPDTVGSVATE